MQKFKEKFTFLLLEEVKVKNLIFENYSNALQYSKVYQ